MRLLATLALLLICSTGHTAAEICPDGITYTDTSSNTCPINSTNLSVLDIAQTTATISGTADSQASTAGTSYYWVSASQWPSGCTSLNYAYADLSSGVTATRQAAEKARQKCMNYKTMAAGTGAVAYGSATLAAAGVYTVSMTGLTAGTTYYVQHWVAGGAGGAGKIGKLSTQSFATNASGGAPGETLVADTGAAPRYVGGGSDLNTGLSHAQRWASLAMISCAMPAGTNVGLFNTTTFTGAASQLNICYDSASTDWAIVGSYKLNGSSVPIWTVDGIRGATETDQKAKILGPLTQGCLDARNCAYTLAAYQANGQTSLYDPAVSITGNYVEFKNIDFDMQLGYSIVVSGTGNTSLADTGPGSTHHVILDGIDSKNNGGGPYVFVDGFKDGVFRNGTVDTWGTCYQLKLLGNSSANSDYTCPSGVVPSVGGLVRSYNGRLLVENNDFYRGIGEGAFDCGERTSHMIVRGNRLGGSTGPGHYTDGCSSTVIENNIIVGSNDHGIYGAGNTGPGSGQGIALDIETWQSPNANNATDTLMRNNLIVRPATCFALGMGSAPDAAGNMIGARISGNTCIASNTTDLSLWYEASGIGSDIEELYVRNNAFWTEGTPTWTIGSYSAISNNHSLAARSANGGTSASTGLPDLVTSTYATWAGYKGPSSWPTFALARPAASSGSSKLIGTGVATESAVFTWAEFGFAATEMADYKSGAITAAYWILERKYDALNSVLDATPPIGAVCAAAGC